MRLFDFLRCVRAEETKRSFGLQTLMRSYLLRIDDRVIERPQYLFMRVAVALHGSDVSKVLETYTLLSLRLFIHATPTLFNAGTRKPQLSSCFLLSVKEDSIEGIFRTLSDCAIISKNAGGIGLNVHDIRGSGCVNICLHCELVSNRVQRSSVSGVNGCSNGLVPMLQVFNSTARYVSQGANKRPGAITIYIEPWHVDLFAVLDLKKNTR